MTTPGFTAEASVNRTTTRQRQVRRTPPDATPRLEMAQLGLPSLAPPVQSALPDRLNIIYGNWCGYDRGSGTPRDKVDQVCCRHDKCYEKRGDLACSCDRDLILAMPGAMAHASTPRAGREAGAKIMAFFASDPLCLCHKIWFPEPVGWQKAPFPVPGIPGPLKHCPFPYGSN
jgi:hypothetical protein